MFKNEYQGGAVVEIFSANGKDPVGKWKLIGGPTAISKVFDKELKGFIYSLEGSSQQNKMQLPKDGKMPLVLIQRFLVLQVNVPLYKDFSSELTVTDRQHLKRRLYLSTVHKEFSATPLHARIPLTDLKRNTWYNLCIDLASFTAALFRGAEFVSLDGIVISACCKIRRIFTMRVEPLLSNELEDCTDRVFYYIRNGLKVEIPQSCQFPSDVHHVTQRVNINGQFGLKSDPTSSESEQTSSGRESTARGPKTQEISHIAFGSKVTGCPPLTARKSSSSAHWTEHRGRGKSLQPRPPTEGALPERVGHRRAYKLGNHVDISYSAQEETEPLQKTLLYNVQQTCSSTSLEEDSSADHNITDEDYSSHTTGQTSRPPQSQSSSTPLLQRCVLEEGDNDTTGTETELSLGNAEEKNAGEVFTEPSPSNAEEKNAGEIFTFASWPHSAKRSQPSSDQLLDLSSDLKGDKQGHEGERKEARLEDDFIGSEGEEDERFPAFHSQRHPVHFSPPPPPPRTPHSLPISILSSSSSTRLHPEPDKVQTSTAVQASLQCGLRIPRSSVLSSTAEPAQVQSSSDESAQGQILHCGSESSRSTEGVRVAPTRCLSPTTARPLCKQESPGPGRSRPDGDPGTSISRTSVREIPSEDLRLQQVRWGPRRTPVGSSQGDLQKSLDQEEDEEEELRMLASLRREQEEEEEEEEGGATGNPGLSASQVHQCNVSLSMSSDDTSTWTQCIPLAAEQGQYYQKEMNPLLHSNPREWMDVLSPPIIHPSQQLTESKGIHSRISNTGSKAQENCGEDEFLSLLYDPCLNCYFDPQTGKYYELI